MVRAYSQGGASDVRDHLDDACPGCVADLVVAYVLADIERRDGQQQAVNVLAGDRRRCRER